LIFQALLWPLVFAKTKSRVILRGGTHVPFSPPYHYLAEVAQPAFRAFNGFCDVQLDAWGWMQDGKGSISATIRPVPRLVPVTFERIQPTRVHGIAAVTNLPAHIPQRMASRAHNLLRDAGLKTSIRPVRERGEGPGAGLFLWVQQAGFGVLGRQGWPSEKVAEATVAELLSFVENETAAVDPYLADQLLIPMALADGRSSFTTNRLTGHALTNATLLRRWLDVSIAVEGEPSGPGRVTVEGVGFSIS
jgi:RNA 3'-terminal phosphate cyclase (ATP)